VTIPRLPRRTALLPITVAVAINVVAWTLLVVLAHGTRSAGAGVLGLGTGTLAYTLGLRHAFDADHIAAIDNTTRKLVSDGRQSSSVGLHFSVGHSLVVFAACGLVAAGAARAGHALGGTTWVAVQTAVCVLFLYVVAGINIATLLRIVRARTSGRATAHAHPSGLLSRVVEPLARRIDAQWKVLPIGVLFGLSFDTATEIALLALSGKTAATAPAEAVALTVCLPLLFLAGMALFDTADGLLMTYAYRWSAGDALRRRRYDGLITMIAAVAALTVGTLELVGLLGDVPSLAGALPSLPDLSSLGYWLVAVLLMVWLGALGITRARRTSRP